jgi:hypothetical protein
MAQDGSQRKKKMSALTWVRQGSPPGLLKPALHSPLPDTGSWAKTKLGFVLWVQEHRSQAYQEHVHLQVLHCWE